MQSSNKKIKIVETPRDGLQGLETIISTKKKIEYINLLLQCGFDNVEVGSFVSAKAILQMANTVEVIDNLDYSKTNFRLSFAKVSVANNFNLFAFSIQQGMATVAVKFFKASIVIGDKGLPGLFTVILSG